MLIHGLGRERSVSDVLTIQNEILRCSKCGKYKYAYEYVNMYENAYKLYKICCRCLRYQQRVNYLRKNMAQLLCFFDGDYTLDEIFMNS